MHTGGTGYFAFYAQKGVDADEVVYRDFDLEYPPVAWWVAIVPRLIDPHKYSETRVSKETIRQYQSWYWRWFHVEMFLVDVACLWLSLAIGRRVSRAAEFALPAAYTLITIAQPHFMYDCLDLVLLLFFQLCIYCWLRSLESSRATYWALRKLFIPWAWESATRSCLIFVPFLLLADLAPLANLGD